MSERNEPGKTPISKLRWDIRSPLQRTAKGWAHAAHFSSQLTEYTPPPCTGTPVVTLQPTQRNRKKSKGRHLVLDQWGSLDNRVSLVPHHYRIGPWEGVGGRAVE